MMCATCLGLKISLTILAVVIIIISGSCTCEALEVLFPLSSVKLNIPLGEKSLSILTKIPFGRFQVAYTNNGSMVHHGYKYILENNIENHLKINSQTGEIYLTENFQNLNETRKFIITAESEKQRKEQEQKQINKNPHMLLAVKPQEISEFCANLENLCYWYEAHYTVVEDLHQMETRPKRLGLIRPNGFKYLCPHNEIIYSIENKSDQLIIRDSVLYAKGPIDHETLHSAASNNISVNLNCMVKTSSSTMEEFRRQINVTVVDRNDNGPKLQDYKFFNFDLKDPHFKVNDTIGEKIIFLDNDTMETNTHQTYKINNDTFDLLQPSCNAYETDHTGKRTSFISCQIIFTRNGILSVTPYCVTLVASDSTIDSNVAKSATANICIRTDLNKIHEADRPTALALRSSSSGSGGSGRHHRKSSSIVSSDESLTENESFAGFGNNRMRTHPVSIVYPKDVYIYRTAMMWKRVTQPEDFVNMIRSQRLRFTISEDRSGAFGITNVGGIIYIRNVTALQNALESVYFVNVTWQDTYNRCFIINMRLISGRPVNATCEHKVKSRTQSCAQIKTRKQCTKFCGLATDGGSCQWRGTNNGFGRNYASCVPNSTFCPDNICDPLEEFDVFICPQDCANSNKIMGPHTTNDNKRGILSASGTCICEDNGKCSCAPLDEDEADAKSKRNGKKRNNLKTEMINNGVGRISNLALSENNTSQSTMANDGLVCGASCISLAIMCPIILIAILICSIVLRKTFKQTVKANSKSAKSNSDCDIRNGDLPLMSLDSSFKFDSCDAKWEVSKELLILDTVLGEGEFGKVIKGYATDIAGMPGVTTVAVKMLKSGANSVEYMALMSEFKLLQEVSHPNVIKLLGACTKGENPMIIIEYARHGSLRSYLRLSRKIECAGVDFTDGVEAVTVKDILSFAWQICKGMAYLTEIKLVHRDLAARNVLLADGKICKVSDFGLTRDVYEDDAYLKRSRDRVPVKWMAPESLADHVYTTKSDVWAFGVLAWELITLGASPYPGVPPQNLYHLLKSGYRMERPENCSEDIYAIVRTCWADDSNSRPSFKYLASQFEKFLGNNAKYIEIESNAISNPLYFVGEANESGKDLSKLIENLGEPESLEHLWRPPKMSYDTNDCTNSRDLLSSSITANNLEFLVPPGYDMPRPLIETTTTEQVLRYENDLRFVLNIEKTERSSSIAAPTAIAHYSVPVKRGRSYMDMTNKTFIPYNLDNNDVEKNISKNISFRFSSLLNLNEQDIGT